MRVVEDGETLTLCSGEEIVVGEEEEEEEKKAPPPPRRPPPPPPAPPEPVVVSPQQQAYDDNVDNVRTTMTSRCTGSGCHGFTGNFDGIWNKRTQVKDRINRAAGADGAMPPSGRLSQAQIDAIEKWLDM